ncbi:MAG: AMP-binding enzyme [bacterium]
MIKALIVKDSNNSLLTADYIIKYCGRELEPAAVPALVEFLDELPKTAHGKIDKLKLKNSV